MTLIESYRFDEFSMWNESADSKKWWITSYFITKNGKEIYRHYPCGYLPNEVLNKWEKFTGLKSKNEFNSKFGSYVYCKNGIDYVTAPIKNGDRSITTFIPVSEKEKITEKLGGWNWQFDPKSETGFTHLVPPHCVINNRPN